MTSVKWPCRRPPAAAPDRSARRVYGPNRPGRGVRRRPRGLDADHLGEPERAQMREQRAVARADVERRPAIRQFAELPAQRLRVARGRVFGLRGAVVSGVGIGPGELARLGHPRGVQELAPRAHDHAQVHELRFLARRVGQLADPPSIDPLGEALVRIVGVPADGARPDRQHARTVYPSVSSAAPGNRIPIFPSITASTATGSSRRPAPLQRNAETPRRPPPISINRMNPSTL